LNREQPSGFPEHLARALAAIVGLTVAARVIEENRIAHSTHAWASHASTLDPAGNMEGLPAQRRHFRHEWQTVKFSITVERGEDMSQFMHLHQLSTRKGWKRSRHFRTPKQ
jgi:hypothetical protein